MTEEMQELGRRAVAASQGRILHALGARLWSESEGDYWRVYMGPINPESRFKGYAIGEMGGTLRLADISSDCGLLPDPSDPATLGCLLALVVQDAAEWNLDKTGANYELDIIPKGGPARLVTFFGGSVAEVLVAALEAAGA